ncbi:hypothetical protein H7H82_12105 [Mycobacterium heidelbergense]|uniref:DUF6542 domain-containing protein n=1 Tax=Mycobacterium heidelbergense TaxID=53376 RepID=A0A1X0DR54_MYCHE|nr:DUF6542 domain-containing protein [Mycobacterium heidelbergense]MCV7051329.1 hypothetical protein [Mycobacterium heidelbergense]ORA74863.1 hypothetical protein BST25_06940 [Mycobacterium heidelbergense]
MSAQREGSAVEAGHRSAYPGIPGVPWWAALLIALTATVIGYAIDAGHKDLTHVFAGLYIAGCVAAVLAVRQDGVFTAIIQPPLILFCAVPGAYWLFHGRKVGNLKDLLINCGYPLIERFPLMLGTAGGVLLIGLIRWYFGMSHQAAAATTGAPKESNSFVSAVAAGLNSLLRLNSPADDSDETPADPKKARGPRKATPKAGRARGDRSASRPARTPSRQGRPSLEDEHQPAVERQRRPSRRGQDPSDPPRRRRPRPDDDADRRAQAPRETRRDPRQPRRNPYEWPYEGPVPRDSRFDDYDMHEPRRRTPHGANPTHHPISRVRYRGEAPLDDAGRRGRPRPPVESWEYDA